MKRAMSIQADILQKLLSDECTEKVIVDVLDELKIAVFRSATISEAFGKVCSIKANHLDRIREIQREIDRLTVGTDTRVCGVCCCVRHVDAMEEREDFGVKWACLDECAGKLDAEAEDANPHVSVGF